MRKTRGSNWKIWLLIVVLLIVIAVLGFLCVRAFLNLDLTSTSNVAVSTLPTQVAAQDSKGKNVSNRISVEEGTLRPDIADEDAELTLMEINWTGKKEANVPLIITVTNDEFPDDDGLSVFHYTDNEWELLGTYLIKDHSVSFQTDSLSPFAFEVVSSHPEPTPTPEPTATPEPTPTPIPTPEPIDYGTYDSARIGEFTQVTALETGGEYVIAVIDDTDSEADDNVTFFDTTEDTESITATVLINYNGTELRTVDVEVQKDFNGNYYTVEPVRDGMVWTAVLGEYYGDAVRYSLVNNEVYLNLDENNENVVLDDNSVRTRWLYGSAKIGTADDGSDITTNTMSYYVDTTPYYVDGFKMTSIVSEEGTSNGKTMEFTVNTDSTKSVTFVLLALRDTSSSANSNTSGWTSGTIILTDVPDEITGIDATPSPTATPDYSSVVTPIVTPNNGNSGGSSSSSGTEVPVFTPSGGSSGSVASSGNAGTTTPTTPPSTTTAPTVTTAPVTDPTTAPVTEPTQAPAEPATDS